mmetsp:Transcript_34597/g.68105  ORF Transcript_34597/g.68105 Transcript_34597/m.68105 type:complete len:326 (+) Transcript_34597:208-1185(+)
MICLLLMLFLHKRGIYPPPRNELLVTAPFQRNTLIYHDNGICTHHGSKPMGHQHHGRLTLLHQRRDRLLHPLLTVLVQSARRLVQQDNPRAPQEHPRNSDPLPLAAAQPITALPDPRVVSVLHVDDEVVRERFGGGGDDVLLRVLVFVHPEGDVLRDGGGEEFRLLGHHTEQAPELVHAQGSVGASVETERPLPGIVEPQKHIDNGGLASARSAHQRDGLPGRDIEIESLQHHVIRAHLVVKSNITYFQMSLHVPVYLCPFIRINIWCRIPERKHLLRPGGTPRKIRHQPLQTLVGPVHHIPEQLERHQLPHGHLVVVDQASPKI